MVAPRVYSAMTCGEARPRATLRGRGSGRRAHLLHGGVLRDVEDEVLARGLVARADGHHLAMVRVGAHGAGGRRRPLLLIGCVSAKLVANASPGPGDRTAMRWRCRPGTKCAAHRSASISPPSSATRSPAATPRRAPRARWAPAQPANRPGLRANSKAAKSPSHPAPACTRTAGPARVCSVTCHVRRSSYVHPKGLRRS